MWPRQESNLDLELRKLLYYPLYYEASQIMNYGSRIMSEGAFLLQTSQHCPQYLHCYCNQNYSKKIYALEAIFDPQFFPYLNM